MQRTFIINLLTVKKDGSPHVTPIWFILDDRKSRTRNEGSKNIVFTAYERSLKAINIQRNNRVSICISVRHHNFPL